MTAITGSSGRGKSTLLYLLGLMLKPTSGEIFISGRAVNDLSDSARSQIRAWQFGFVFQDAALDPTRTILDNVTETALYRGQEREKMKDRALALLERFEVQTPPDRKPGQVSGGQAQRIALCRSLLNDPKILLADEPTGNLDAETSKLVVNSFRTAAESGACVIVVTHSDEMAKDLGREIKL